MEKIMNVKGMHCKSCEILLTDVISEIKGVDKVTVEHKNGTVKISYSDEKIIPGIKKAIEAEGYTVE